MIKRIIKIIVVSLCLVACNLNVDVVKPKGFEDINYNELCALLDGDNTFLLYVGRPDCKDCVEFDPIIKDYIQTHKDTGVYYLNIKEYRDAARKENASQKEKDFYENLNEELDFDWTPTVEVISCGKVIKKYQYLDEDYYQIKDKETKEKTKKEFINQFNEFMNQYFQKYYK